MKFKVEIDDSDLAKLLRPTVQTIQCKGVSCNSEPINALVEMIAAPRSSMYSGESYVLCPRLKEFHEGGSSYLGCYEGPSGEYDKFNKANLKVMVCPYHRSKRE